MPKSRRCECVLPAPVLGLSHRTSASERSVTLCIERIVFCWYSQQPADATGPRGAIAASRLAVIHRPVRQIVGRHGNNLVPSLHEAGGPDGGSVCLGDVMLFTAAASCPSFPVSSNWKPRLSKKKSAAPFKDCRSRALSRRQRHSGSLMSEGVLSHQQHVIIPGVTSSLHQSAKCAEGSRNKSEDGSVRQTRRRAGSRLKRKRGDLSQDESRVPEVARCRELESAANVPAAVISRCQRR